MSRFSFDVRKSSEATTLFVQPATPAPTPSGREINQQGVAVDEAHTFWSDLLGTSFLDLDLKGTTFDAPVCSAANTPELTGRESTRSGELVAKSP